MYFIIKHGGIDYQDEFASDEVVDENVPDVCLTRMKMVNKFFNRTLQEKGKSEGLTLSVKKWAIVDDLNEMCRYMKDKNAMLEGTNC